MNPDEGKDVFAEPDCPKTQTVTMFEFPVNRGEIRKVSLRFATKERYVIKEEKIWRFPLDSNPRRANIAEGLSVKRMGGIRFPRDFPNAAS